MKKIAAMILCCLLMLNAGSVLASGEDFSTWYTTYAYSVGLPSPTKTVLEWNRYMVNHNFPTHILRGVSAECRNWNGTPLNALGLEPTSGSNLRSFPDFSTNSTILAKVHGNEPVFIYFSFYFPYNNRVWYYAVTEYGLEGFLVSTRIWIVP